MRCVDESWDQIGKRLRAAREKGDMTVDDVVFRARLPRNVVEALEADDFSFFTSPTYAKSFLRQYSEFLQVDAEPWLEALEPASYIGGESWSPMVETGGASRRTSPEPRKQETREKVPASGRWSAFWLTCFSALLIAGAVKGYQIMEEKLGKSEGEDIPSATVPPSAPVLPLPDPVRTEPVGLPAPGAVPAAPPREMKKEEHASNDPPRAVIVRE